MLADRLAQARLALQVGDEQGPTDPICERPQVAHDRVAITGNRRSRGTITIMYSHSRDRAAAANEVVLPSRQNETYICLLSTDGIGSEAGPGRAR